MWIFKRVSAVKQSTEKINLHNLEFDISDEFIQENKLFIPKEISRKGGPYSKNERVKRRSEVYRLHFEYGYSALKISELMKINRNTINSDIQYCYEKVSKNWLGLSPDFLVLKHIQRLELSRTRLREYLDKTKNLQEKLAIERMILDVESKIGQTQLKLCGTNEMVHKLSTKWLNEWMKENRHKDRYLSYGDILRVPNKSYEKIERLMKGN